jgi:hypothetical protein
MTPHPFPRYQRSPHPLAIVLLTLGLILFLAQTSTARMENPSAPAESPQPRADFPVAQVGFQIFSGNGNHAIDPNECNALNLILTNTSGTTISGINASFASTDPDVIVTQPLTTFPDLPAASTRTNDVPLQISTLPSFAAGRTIYGILTITSLNSGVLSIPVTLTTGEISPVGSRFDINAVLGIPDVGVAESTNVVTGFTGVLAKVVVSIYLTDPSDQSLTNISLIGPDGTTVLLSAGNGGAGQNYGSGTADASRTVFDDSATKAITAGSAPFVGAFSPQMPLSGFSGETNVNGAWRLQIANDLSGSGGTLQAWSLFLYPITSADGGGACALCSGDTILTNYISASSALLPQRLLRDSTRSVCGLAKTYPEILTNYNGGFSYQAYPFYNGSSNTCIDVTLVSPTANIMSAAFANAFDPNDPKATYLADSGASTGSASVLSYSFSVNPDSVFIILVNEISEINVTGTNANGSYILSVTGGDCIPRLNIAHANTNQIDVTWPAISGDYRLETSPQITPLLWSFITNEPVAAAGCFNVTKRSDLSPLQIYRLQSY